ncbi:hypothetical protein [Demequina iriomotensis]|uniref:hypothetical protein n=1 Tax=Demequina iriomotensis TaxID=1536641 RepID=UPI000780ADD3|nr:hypothetical protein [Demequina iriomotensis]
MSEPETDAPEADGAPTPAAPPRETRQRPRRGLVVALALSLVVVVGLGVAVALLATSRHLWEDQNAQLRDRVEVLTGQVSADSARIASLEESERQLAALKEEYSAAVNAGAQGTELVEELEDIVDAYARCVEAQADHFEVLRHADRYVASSIDESERSILDYCAEVEDAYDAFQASHG